MAAARRIVIVVFPGVHTLDVTGPLEVFDTAGRFADRPYRVEVVAAQREVRTSSGLGLVAHRSFREVRGPIDTLLVAGSTDPRAALHDEELIRFLERARRRSRRVAGVCTGAFLLARAGILDGRRATTHWAACRELRRRFPSVTVEEDPIFVRDGEVWTSAGSTSGMDLALALVEEDLGRSVALETARWLVLFLKRPGGQAQFSAALSTQVAERQPLREAQAFIADHPDADLSVAALAARAHMSTRTFARAFRHETGATPGAYVEAARVERARQELEARATPVEVIAVRCGFGTPETMRRAFRRRLGVTPSDYRGRFARAA
jgi:transcriptional regulator GlxA family with amidase domain